MLARLSTQYVDALEWNIWDIFPTKIINVLEAFHIFEIGMLPKEKSKQFGVFGKEEVQIFKNHYF